MFVFRTGLRQRNPLLRLIGGALGLLAVLGLLAIGAFAFLALFVGGLVWFLFHAVFGKRRSAPRPAPVSASTSADNGVIDGEFIVVRDQEPRARIEPSVTSAVRRNP